MTKIWDYAKTFEIFRAGEGHRPKRRTAKILKKMIRMKKKKMKQNTFTPAVVLRKKVL